MIGSLLVLEMYLPANAKFWGCTNLDYNKILKGKNHNSHHMFSM